MLKDNLPEFEWKENTMKRFGIKKAMSDEDRSRLDQRVSEAEKKTGAEIVLSVVDRCDAYPELPWKAFALGASLVGLTIFIIDMLRSVWISGASTLWSVGMMLAAGAACALLCVLLPGIARIFLDKERAELEARQCAESLFLSRELFATSKRNGILMLIGLFERQVILLPDTGLGSQLDKNMLEKIIARMTKTLASGMVADALEEGVQGLEEVLSAATSGKSKNELSDNVIEEEGP